MRIWKRISTNHQQLDSETENNKPVVEFYPLEQKPTQEFISLLQQLVPQAQVTHDASNKRLVVIARAEEQQKIQENINKLLEGNTETSESVLRSYSLSTIQKQRFQALLPTLQQDYPGLQVLPETVPGELSIWARPEQHEKLLSVMEQVKSDVPLTEKQQLVSYKLKVAEPNETVVCTAEPLPGHQVHGRDSNPLYSCLDTSCREVIKSALEQIDNGTPGEFQQNTSILP
ncbi:MAG: hypothetical protein R3C11_18590 [Planctomycetaceae bacterium]